MCVFWIDLLGLVVEHFAPGDGKLLSETWSRSDGMFVGWLQSLSIAALVWCADPDSGSTSVF